MKKPPRSTRVDAPQQPPPPPLGGSQPAAPAAPATMPSSAGAAAWWGGQYTTASSATTSIRAAPPYDKQGTQAGQAEAALQDSDPLKWGNDPRPLGGFVNFLKGAPPIPFPQQFPHHTPMSQNFHFGGGPAPAHYASFQPPQPPVSKEIPSPSLIDLTSSQLPSGSQSNKFVDVDSPEDGEVRTSKRLIWNPDEDRRLMSSWLNNSNDPINGNNKKNEQYWSDVAAVYNSTTPKNRWRTAKQAKDRWHTVNKLVYQFQYSWNKAYKIYSSGQSDDQLMNKAHAFYESDWGGQFLLTKVWKAVRDKPKWHNYNEHLEEAKKKRRRNEEEPGEHTPSAKPPEDEPHPMGTKQAKALRSGKGKLKEATAELEELEKYQEIQLEASKNRSMILEKQERLSAEKLEAARLSHLAALENKEAKKHDKESEMWRTYRAMISQDTSGMSKNVKDEYVEALKVMRQTLNATNK